MNLWLPGGVILAALVALICVKPGPEIFEQEIVLNQQAMRCFQIVTDYKHYPSWVDSVKSTKSDVEPSAALPGTEFELIFARNYIDPNRMTAHIKEIVEGMRFSFTLDDFLKSELNFTIKSLPKGACKITVTMSSGSSSLINNNVIIPTIRMYLYNWMFKSMMALKSMLHVRD
ncbi:hypothetical protein SprV_0602166100 [Sparganum proliferum]